MLSGSFAAARQDPKRRRSLPIPKSVADMKTFTPDSSVVSDVIPSPNFGDRNKGRAPDMILLHYTGMPDVEGALARLCQAGTEVSAHYVVLEDGRIVQCVPEIEARLACRAVVLGRRGGHQLLLDRHRDRQSRPRLGLSGFPAAPGRGGDRAVPRHHHPPRHPAASRAGAFRRRARPQAGPRREIPLARAVGFRRRALGAAGADRAGRCDEAGCRRRRGAGAAARAGRLRLRPDAQRALRRTRRRKSSPRSSAISVRKRSTASPTASTLATLHALLSGLPARQAMHVATDVLAGRP